MKPNKSTMIVGNLEFCSLIEQITKGMLETENAHTHASYFFANGNFSRHFFLLGWTAIEFAILKVNRVMVLA